LILDSLEHLGGDVVDIAPGFLGMPEGLLSGVLANLAGLGLLSGEGIMPTPRQPHVWSQDIQVAGQVREAQEARDREAPRHIPQGPKPRGFAKPE
jgi:hypothetical protein